MKIMVFTDMEGVAGVLNHDDWVLQTGRFFDKGLRLLTGEVNAAIDGLCAGGATEVIVVDAHGAGGIDPELLDERAVLVRGVRRPTWPWGLDASYDGLAFVGQHAKAGTPYSHITHTQWFDVVDLVLNGISIGEYGQMALCAMELGVPTILACGEKALTEEAEALTPGVVTAWGKVGLLPDGLDHLDMDAYRKAKLSATHCSPAVTRRRIREAAEHAARKLAKDPGTFRYPPLKPPYTMEARFRKIGDRPAREGREEHPHSIIALMNPKPKE
jgi:D-amino peptidase